MRAFIVDDQDFAQDLAKRILTKMGIDAHAFGDGAKALEAMPDLQPQLVLVDYEMSPMSGVEFVKRVRAARQSWSRTAILMITGHTSPEHVRQAQAAGIDGYVVKPYSPNSMRLRVEKVLADRRSSLVTLDG